MGMEAKEIAIAQLEGRASNPRRKLGDIAGLAASIKAYGVLEPLVVRPRGKRFEVIAGHRRLAAAKQAKLRVVPCVVRRFDDLEVQGAALVENLQREGLDPVDEGDAIAAFVEAGTPLEEVALKLGRSVSYVAKRRQLAGLHPKVRAAITKGEIAIGVGLQIARLPKSQHLEALEQLDGCSEAEAAATIGRTFLLRLADAPFSRTDATLQPKAGACSKCPKRTGAQAVLFDDVGGSRDTCTDRLCYQAKSALAWAKRAADHIAAGGAAIDDPEQIRKVLGWSERPSYSSGYVACDDLIHLVEGYPDGIELRTLAKLRGLDLQVTLARAESGAVVELFRRKDAAQILAQVPGASGVAAAAVLEDPDPPDSSKERRKVAKMVGETTRGLLAGIGLRCSAEGVELAGWRTLLGLVVEELGYSCLPDTRIEELAQIAEGGSANLFALHAGIAEVLLAYAAERRPDSMLPALERFADVHGVAVGGDDVEVGEVTGADGEPNWSAIREGMITPDKAPPSGDEAASDV